MATVTRPDAEQLAAEGLELVGDDAIRSLALDAAGYANLARATDVRRSPPCGARSSWRSTGHPMAVVPRSTSSATPWS